MPYSPPPARQLEAGPLPEIAATYRARRVAVELRTPLDQATGAAAAAAAAKLGESGLPPSDLMRPADLFESYAKARNLSASLVTLGQQVGPDGRVPRTACWTRRACRRALSLPG